MRGGPRHRLACAAGVGLLVLSGCGTGGISGIGGEADGPGTDDPPDCAAADCVAEVAAYAEALAGLEGVERVVDVSYRARQITDVPQVRGEIHVDAATDCAGLEDDVGRLLWASQVSPVSSVTLECYLPGATGPDYDYVSSSFVLEDPDELVSRWGPRGG